MKNFAPKLDENFFAKFNNIKRFKKNQLILSPEMQPSGIYYVKSGHIRQYLISTDGKELTVNILKPGLYFPMIWALNNTENIYFYECITPTVLLKASKEAVIKQLKDNPELLYDFTKRILSGLDGITQTMETLLTKNAYKKITFVVLILTRRFGKFVNENEIKINIPLTHKLLGTIAGLTRESTSREMEKLTKNKIIYKKNGFIIVKDLKKLEAELLIRSAENTIL